MNKQVYKNLEILSLELAEWITSLIEEKLQIQSRFCIALSGGNTPKRLNELLSTSPYRERIDWRKIHVFFGDERAVPLEDERNNARMAFDTLLNKVDIPADQIHIMQTQLTPEKAAEQYETVLQQYFGGSEKNFPETTFDLILLGMGDDGHTLSLFPGTAVIHEERKWAASLFLPAQDMFRITITKNIANRANYIVFMISGSGKSHALREVLEGQYDPDRYPSQVIEPLHGELHFFLDEAAAAEL
ncbi:MAG: 6-phosphogluconolactonase [Bacteroidota bacterium]|nr:6-phosphogluconolactonase [Bacteroidota bacterium]